MRRPGVLGAVTLGYLLGTAPSADVAARLASGGTTDLRASGSGNPGATNAMAVLGRSWGYAVMAADIAKGAVAAAAGRRIAGPLGAHAAGVAAVVGHCYPVWNGFRGGKGVAASVGQCAVTFPAWTVPDLALAGAVAASPRWRSRALAATAVASAGWVAAGVLWWRRSWPNLWGPAPTGSLPLAAAASSAVILTRFAAARPLAVIALVTDSNAQLPPELVERYGVEVVPLAVTVDGEDLLEGVDIDADAFYARFTATGTPPVVSTSQASPGQFAAAYEKVVAGGATTILSVHVGASVSGTVNSARLAARDAAVPVRVVDTGTASFGVGCCVWEAGEALARGASVEEAALVAETLGATVGNVFTVSALDLVRAGGRLAAGVEAPAVGIPVLSLVAGEVKAVGQAGDVAEAAEVMAAYALAAGDRLRVAVGIADAGAAPLWHALEDRLAGAPEVREIVRYRVGPSVGAHTGPGTAGAFFYPSP